MIKRGIEHILGIKLRKNLEVIFGNSKDSGSYTLDFYFLGLSNKILLLARVSLEKI